MSLNDEATKQTEGAPGLFLARIVLSLRRQLVLRSLPRAVERDQIDQQQIGERDSGEFDRERELGRVPVPAQQGRAEQHDLARQQQRGNPVAKHPHGVAAA